MFSLYGVRASATASQTEVRGQEEGHPTFFMDEDSAQKGYQDRRQFKAGFIINFSQQQCK